MPTVNLTARSVENWKPNPAKRQEVPDGLCQGLYLLVTERGAKSWTLRYRHEGKPRKYTLGPKPPHPHQHQLFNHQHHIHQHKLFHLVSDIFITER